MTRQKNAVAINDISGVGRCSVTVACPILSASGIETSVLPTAVLSTHTGGFSNFTFLDLTDEMKKIAAHWKSLGLSFDAIYSGYLGSADQIEIVSDFIDTFKKADSLIVVDPVMGDSGRFYTGFTPKIANGMKKLCKKADLILPNITEAHFLLGREYKEGPYTEAYIKEILKDITKMGCKKAVLTGVHFDMMSVGAASYDSEANAFEISLSRRVDGFYHGTGDVFASTVVAALMNGKTLAEATSIAVSFTHDAIVRTAEAMTDTRYGVLFEKSIPKLIKALGL